MFERKRQLCSFLVNITSQRSIFTPWLLDLLLLLLFHFLLTSNFLLLPHSSLSRIRIQNFNETNRFLLMHGGVSPSHPYFILSTTLMNVLSKWIQKRENASSKDKLFWLNFLLLSRFTILYLPLPTIDRSEYSGCDSSESPHLGEIWFQTPVQTREVHHANMP